MSHINKSKLSAICFSIAIGVTASHAQINLNSTNINVRSSSSNTATTQHYGNLKIMASNTSSPAKILEIIDQTSASTVQYRYGLYSTCNNQPGYGYGGYFEGGSYGVYGVSQLSGSGTRYGGYFSGANSTTDATVYRNTYGIRTFATCGANSKMTIYGIYSSVTGGTGAIAYAGYFNGNLSYTGNLTKESDKNLKKNIETYSDGLQTVLRLRPVKYDYDIENNKEMNMPTGKQLGLIAQEVEQVLPEIVHVEVAPPLENDASTNNEERATIETYKSVDYISLIPVLVQAIQDQQKKIDKLEKMISKQY